LSSIIEVTHYLLVIDIIVPFEHNGD